MAGLTVSAMTVRFGTSGALKTYRSLMSRSPCSECGANWPSTTVPPRAGASRWSAALERSGATPRVRTTSVVPRAASFRACMVSIESSSDGRGGLPRSEAAWAGPSRSSRPAVSGSTFGAQLEEVRMTRIRSSDRADVRPRFGRDSAPEPVVRSLGIPAGRRGEPLGITRIEEWLAGVLVEIAESQAGRFRDRDGAVRDERPGQAADEAAPLRDVGGVVLQSKEVFGRSGGMDAGESGHGRAGHVERHRDAVLAGVVADPLGLQDPARSHDVGVDDADGAPLDQVPEPVAQVDVLAGTDRCRDR